MFIYNYFWPDVTNSEITSSDQTMFDLKHKVSMSEAHLKKPDDISLSTRSLALKEFTSIKKGFKGLPFLNTWDCKIYGVDSSKVDNIKNYNNIISGFEKDLNWLISETNLKNCNGGLVGKLNSDISENIHTIDLFIYSSTKVSKILEIDDDKKVLKYYRITYNYDEGNPIKSISKSYIVSLVHGDITDKIIQYFMRELMNLGNDDEECSIEKKQKFIKVKELLMLKTISL